MTIFTATEAIQAPRRGGPQKNCNEPLVQIRVIEERWEGREKEVGWGE